MGTEEQKNSIKKPHCSKYLGIKIEQNNKNNNEIKKKNNENNRNNNNNIKSALKFR